MTLRSSLWLLLPATAAAASSAHGTGAYATARTGAPPRTSALLGPMPLAFEENRGQLDPRVRFAVRGQACTALVTNDGLLFNLRSRTSEKRSHARPLLERTASVRMRLDGGAGSAEIGGETELPGKVHFYRGQDPRNWHVNVRTFGQLRCAGVYPGVDLVYHASSAKEGTLQQLEYDFHVQPGAHPERIGWSISGARSVHVRPDGALALNTPAGVLRQERPVAYQVKDGSRVPVTAAFAWNGNRLGFRLGSYDHSRPLVIDPVLNYATYLGGSGQDAAAAIAVDNAGSAYVTGSTASANFPAGTGALQGPSDAFVVKFAADGKSLVYSAFLGGSGSDLGTGIAVDAATGIATITGTTTSANFPVSNTAAQKQLGGAAGDSDAFVTRLNATGSALLFSTYLGGSEAETAAGVAVDSSGAAYVTGSTSSANFPGAAQNSLQGQEDIFVTKVDSSGASLVYSKLVGGPDAGHPNPNQNSGFSASEGIAVDGSGSAYVVGTSLAPDYPTTANAFQRTLHGIVNGVVTKLSADGTTLAYSTYLGGSILDDPHGIAVDGQGAAYVVGEADSFDFPVQNALSGGGILNGTSDAFLTKLAANGQSLEFSTFLGGSGTETGRSVVLDTQGNVWITGDTASTDYPVSGAVQAAFGGGNSDLVVTEVNAALNAISFSTYLGGSGDELGFGIAVDATGAAYLAGTTTSADLAVSNPFQATLGGGAGDQDALVARIGEGQGAPQAPDQLQAVAAVGQINLTWRDNSSNEQFFDIERSVQGGDFTPLHTVAAGVTSYADTNILTAVEYSYRVRARNAIGSSAYSNVADVTSLDVVPAAPTGLVAAAIDNSHVLLTWNDNSNNETGFKVERSTDNGVNWSLIATTAANHATTDSYTDSSLTVGTAYSYRVTATNLTGDSAHSNTATVTIPAGGKLQVGPTKLAFGKVKVNKTKTKTLTIKNLGKGPLAGSVSTLEAPYQVTGGLGAFLLGPKKSLKVTVVYSPVATGPANVAITVTSSDPAHTSKSVAVTGTGK